MTSLLILLSISQQLKQILESSQNTFVKHEQLKFISQITIVSRGFLRLNTHDEIETRIQ